VTYVTVWQKKAKKMKKIKTGQGKTLT